MDNKVKAKVRLVSQEGEIITVDEEVATKSTLLNDMITSNLLLPETLYCWFVGKVAMKNLLAFQKSNQQL